MEPTTMDAYAVSALLEFEQKALDLCGRALSRPESAVASVLQGMEAVADAVIAGEIAAHFGYARDVIKRLEQIDSAPDFLAGIEFPAFDEVRIEPNVLQGKF